VMFPFRLIYESIFPDYTPLKINRPLPTNNLAFSSQISDICLF
jgi:hypothetical protein